MYPSFRNVLVATVLASVSFGAAAQGGIDMYPQRAKPPETDPRSRRPDAPDDRQYQYGKEIYAVKLACETCPLGATPLDEKVAKKFLADPSLWESLSAKESDAVETYLKQLYNLR